MKKKTPAFVIILGWLISAVAFAIGFWHTHLGLREFRALSSNYGSLVVSGLILMVLVLAYNRAISGVKSGLYFYLLCATFMFVFNMNSFYPSYLGRNLIKEEAIYLNDTLQSYSSKMNTKVAKTKSGATQELQDLNDFKTTVLTEIVKRDGFGPKATAALAAFNQKAGSNISPDRRLGQTMEERIETRDRFEKEMNGAIDMYIVKKLEEKEKNALFLFKASKFIDSIRKDYTPRLEEIIKNNSRVENLDSVRFLPEIITFSDLVTNIDVFVKDANAALTSETFSKLRDDDANVPLPKTQQLGRIAHTLSSVGDRIGKLDTWAIIILCLFIDFIVPLAVYFMIRRNENDSASGGIVTFGNKPGTF